MRTLLSILLLAGAVNGFAQANKNVKLYAYEQHVMPGVRRITIDESGKEHEAPPKFFSNYFIYLEAPASKKIDIKHIWIKGKLYNVNIEKPKLPVIIQNISMPGRKADTLVRQRLNPVVQIVPSESNQNFSANYSVKKKMKKNDIVIHTIEGGKDCYYYLATIKMLEPLALQ